MLDLPRWHREAAVPIAAGLLWLWYAASFGVVGFLFSLIPGCLLLASGTALLLWPGDLRIPQFAAAGGLLGVPLAVPATFVAGPGTALALIAVSAASFLASGVVALRQEPPVPGVPDPRPSLGLHLQVACDEALLAWMQVRVEARTGRDRARIRQEVEEAAALFDARGWLEKPEAYHQTPPPLESPGLAPARAWRIDHEHLRFESEYEPRPEEPGRERWLGYAANRTAHAQILRHPGGPRPWLLCIHGYQMGEAGVNLMAFEPRYYHQRLGLNLAVPVLPLHGPRRVGRQSGDRFLSGDPLDSLHAEAQAMSDLRRLLDWIRRQGAPAVGVTGLSLGGYQTALLASLEEDLACAVAGIPLTDITRAVWRHGPPLHLLHAEAEGLVRDRVAEVLRPVSPLALAPRVPRERRFIFGGVADRLVPPDQVRDLWEHWERPRIVWYQGAHLTFRSHRAVRELVRDALREGGLTASRDGARAAG